MTDKAPERIWAVTEPDDTSAQILGEVYAQQLPDGMVGNPVEYVRADLAPAVKKLEWVKDEYGVSAETPFGTHYTYGYVGENWSVTYGQRHHGKIIISGVNKNPEVAAKAAAQADFERRVRECLV